MDDCRFDNLTRMLGGLQDRRSALRTLTGAGAALISLARADLGLAADDDVLIEGCRLTGERCKRNNNCCSGVCKGRKKHDKNGKKKREGECKCLGNGKKCKKDAACCKGFCDPKDNRCRCVGSNQTCNKDSDCCGNRKCVSNGATRVCKKHKR
ncbi:MAG: hypothetical protein IT338_08875 [Thermomicrobiales bacterium]|nr:hypothetical protein [Thermomicrobiales bacterium]